MRRVHVWFCGLSLILSLATAFCQTDSLPITRVVLFQSGLAYIERFGTVDGQATLNLNLKTDQVNDLLKSLVLQDMDGGLILPVRYAPKDPLERTLQAFSIKLGDNPSLAELLKRLRGVPVEVYWAVQAPGSPGKTGRVVSVEEVKVTGEDKSVRSEYYLLLATEDEIERFPLSQIRRMTIRDERLQQEFQQALTALASGLDNTRKAVQLEFQGQGKRRVRVGYLMEMPMWKMTYRLVLQEGKKPFLQGWAIVENTSEEDWNQVQVSLIAGQPISFIQELYQPLYVPRPKIQTHLYTPLLPQTYEGAMEKKDQRAEADNALANKADAREEYRAKAARGVMGGLGGRGGDMLAAEAPAPLDISEGVFSMAQGQELGSHFEYRLEIPLTLPRQQSALLPIVNQEVSAEQVSVYNSNVHPKYPLYGVRLKNTTNLTLREGPITVFAEGAYGGDALIETIEPGGNRLLTYAADLEMEANMETLAQTHTVTSLKIRRGVLIENRKLRREQVYTVRNRDKKPRTVLVEHPVSEWQLIEPKGSEERTAKVYRFQISIGADKAEKLKVVEEQPVQQSVTLSSATPDTILVYLQNPTASVALKKALQEVVTRQQKIAGMEAEMSKNQERIKEIEQDQSRIRQNMDRLDRNSQLYQDYVKKLSEQEKELEQIYRTIDDLRPQISQERLALKEYLEKLDVE